MENRFARAERITQMEEFIRLKGHTYLSTTFVGINLLVLLPAGFISWFTSLIGLNGLAWINNMNWWLFIILWLFPLFNWYYSTVTIPIKKGHKYLIDWSKTKKGRWLSALINLSTFHVMTWAAGAKYVTNYYFDYLSSVEVPAMYQGILLVDDMDSLLLLLYFIPFILSVFMVFFQWRDYRIHKDLLAPTFLKWESPLLTRTTHALEMDSCDVIVGYDAETKKPLVIKEDQRYLHQGVWGPTGSGKTSTSILLQIAQDLIKIATGRRKMGLVFLEPKGDGVDDVLTMCKKLGIPDEKIMVIDPTKSFSVKYNPFSGPLEAAAASFQGTLNALAGDQDPFFKGQQDEAAQMYTLLAKIRFGNLTNIVHIQQMFSDPRYLADMVEQVRKSIETKRESPDLTPEVIHLLDNWEAIVNYFENEVLEFATFRVQEEIRPVLYPQDHRYAGKQVVNNKKDKFVTGAKKYLNEIALNSMLSSLFVTEEGDTVFNADEFLADGGVLLINTCLAELEELSLLFGQFFIRQFQSAVFRRPKEERIPIFFYVDEFPLYVNEAFERLLTLGRSYKVGTLIAMQSLGQLDNVVKGFKETILSNTSHKTVFGRGTVTDNKYFSEEFGEKLIMEESLNESASPMTTDQSNWGFRMNSQKKLAPRFTYTDIRELPFKHMVVQVVNENNTIDIATKAVGKFVHEARFLKRYMKLRDSEIKSTVEKDFILEDILKDGGNLSLENIAKAVGETAEELPNFEIPTTEEPYMEQQQQSQEQKPLEDQTSDNLVPFEKPKKQRKAKSKDLDLFEQQKLFDDGKVDVPNVTSRLASELPNVSVPPQEVDKQIKAIVEESKKIQMEEEIKDEVNDLNENLSGYFDSPTYTREDNQGETEQEMEHTEQTQDEPAPTLEDEFNGEMESIASEESTEHVADEIPEKEPVFVNAKQPSPIKHVKTMQEDDF